MSNKNILQLAEATVWMRNALAVEFNAEDYVDEMLTSALKANNILYVINNDESISLVGNSLQEDD
jgi:hypothetical protein